MKTRRVVARWMARCCIGVPGFAEKHRANIRLGSWPYGRSMSAVALEPTGKAMANNSGKEVNSTGRDDSHQVSA